MNFIVFGVAGYIAPRHLQAIKEIGGNVVACYDPHDNVGIMDSFFPKAKFFTEFEILDRYVEMLMLEKEIRIDYVSICSPNYLHDSHIRYALRIGANAICEKPIVLNPWNIDRLIKREEISSGKVNCILQLRQHTEMIRLKQKYSLDLSKKVNVELNYVTSRGAWYMRSWKNDVRKSGGLVTNIGVHFFDALIWLFGEVLSYELESYSELHVKGVLKLKRANVKWFLSINEDDLPFKEREEGIRTYRTFTIGDDSFNFSKGFTDLHTDVYRSIIDGNGNTLQDAKSAIDIVSKIRKEIYGF